ncbi:histone-lysine N-methyltransferase SETMAR [Trichonephila clavipes]|nr:histone-lysine N-methyltransferase SETMAR [Trichonephila clavipes]
MTSTGSQRLSKFRQNLRNVKAMVILVHDCDGVILTYTTADRQYAVLLLLFGAISQTSFEKKQLHFLKNAPTILHDNARQHAAQSVSNVFDLWGWKVLYQPPYSPDLTFCYFDLVP